MKKFYTLLFIFSLSISYSNSQWVTIPDTNFVAFLQQNYPQCMNGNQMDTQCNAIINTTIVDCSNKNISNLSGIEYFTSLYYLNCSFNQISSLNNLPSSLFSLECHNNNLTYLPGNNLNYINCSYNQLTSISSLPPTLEFLRCDGNQITTISSFPSSLKSIWCGHNLLSSLPALPSGLWDLYCGYNQLTSLPALPNGGDFNSLLCFNNNLIVLPALPQSIVTLECDNNQLTSLPNLTNNLQSLNCNNNQLTSCPTLPNSLFQLHCANNQIVNLSNLPSSLYLLDCSNNQITNLPTLSIILEGLFCANNYLFELPNLPPSLVHLNCENNQLDSLPPLPNSLTYLWCSNNQLVSLPELPASLKDFRCDNNFITSLPELPDTLQFFYINDNPNLTCIPNLKKIGYFHYYNLNIQCLPNYPQPYGVLQAIPPLSTYPLCDIFNNPNNCDVYWKISGKVYNDANNNCIDDAGEQSSANLKLQLFENGNLIQQVYSGNEGLYSFDTDTGTFTYTVDTTDLPVMVTCPPSGFHTSVLTPADSMDYNMDFAMQCKPGFDVGVKTIVRTSGQFFPANYATIKIGAGDMASFYGLTCASGISGSVIVDFTGPVSFISEAPGALVPVVNGNTLLTYTIADFSLVNFNSDFRFIVQTDTFTQAGSPVCFTVNVTPTSGDNNISNNSMQHCFTTVNSFDPNAKEVYPEGGLISTQELMTYTIHFQNTGNAPAQHIYILDTLDNNLITSSFTLLSYSHEPLVQLFGNVVKFNFPNINLPDSTNDEPNSHGFVQYKVRMAQGLPIGTVISNTAYNFFDFNPPVATNTVSNMVGVTSIANTNEKIDLSVFPNPATDEINVSFNLNSSSEIEIGLYNSLVQVVKAISKTKYEAGKNLIHFSVNNLPEGVYHLKAIVKNQTTMRKIVKY